jgi:hypothetical protein
MIDRGVDRLGEMRRVPVIVKLSGRDDGRRYEKGERVGGRVDVEALIQAIER